jgi:ABC-type nitrate/sulfonate/bicarbonate transport system permease component
MPRIKLPPGLVTFVAVLALWQAASGSGVIDPALLPPPSTIAPVLWTLFASGEFLVPLSHTLALLFVGYSIACVLGIAIGLAMGCSRRIHALLEPLVELVRPIPKPALVPPLFLFFGIGPTTMLIIVTLAAVFPVLINTIQGVRGVDPILTDTAATFRCSRLRTILAVVLPAALPLILTGMRVSLGLGLVLVILAEMLAGDSGLGFVILDMERSFRIVEMYAWVILLAAIGLLLAVLFERLETWAVPWRSR